MRLRYWGSVCCSMSIIGLAVACSGCGRQATPTPTAKPTAAVQTPLPEWAPEKPSAEFLRAARALKPLPPEMLGSAAQGDAAAGTMLARYRRSFAAAYEFFGSMGEERIEGFLAQQLPKEMRVAVKSLTRAQRVALDEWFAAYREAMTGGPSEFRDYLVMLYKAGAREDLSNVDVGFSTEAGRVVHITFWIKQPSGKAETLSTAFATVS